MGAAPSASRISPYPTFALPSPTGNDHAYAGHDPSGSKAITCACASRGVTGAYPRRAIAVAPPPAGPSAARTAEWAPSAPTTTWARTPATTGSPGTEGSPPSGTVIDRTRRRSSVAPRATAASTSRASRTRRGTTRFGRAVRPASHGPPGYPSSSRSTVGQSSSRPRTPRRASTSRTCGATPSPHDLSLGNSARSSSTTRAPGRAARTARAAAAPAGPAPTTATSASWSVGRAGGVGRRLGRWHGLSMTRLFQGPPAGYDRGMQISKSQVVDFLNSHGQADKAQLVEQHLPGHHRHRPARPAAAAARRRRQPDRAGRPRRPRRQARALSR